jgi:hypothetical protein
MFVFKREEVIGVWRNCMRSFIICTFHEILLTVIKENEICWSHNMHGGMRNACKIMIRKPEGTRQLGRPRHRWEDKIKMYLTKWHGRVLMGYLVQDRVMW